VPDAVPPFAREFAEGFAMGDQEVTPAPLALNCPKCGSPLAYVREDRDVAICHCPNDGMVLLPPDGRVRVVIH
jgi:hypothetical protein